MCCVFLSNAHVNSVLVYMITATLENDSPLHFESICCWELGGQNGSFILIINFLTDLFIA